MKKVLIVSHSCVIPVNRQKAAELAKQPDIEVTLVVPTLWQERQMRKRYLATSGPNGGYKLTSIKAFLNWHGALYFYDPWRLLKEALRYKPDILQLDEEPYSLVAFQGFLLSKMTKSKLVVFSYQDIYKRYPPPFSWIEELVLKHADYAIAGNDEVRDVLVRKGFRKRLKVIPHGFDPLMYYRDEKVSLSMRHGLGLHSFTIGYVGRVVEEKGVHILLQACAKLRHDYAVLIVGNGPFRPYLASLAGKLRMSDKVLLRDSVLHDEVPHYINCMDVLVLPSLTTASWKEQLGRVLIEAMACEIPVIGSDSGNIPNVIGDAGLIFKEGDPEDLAKKLDLLITDPGYRRKLAQKGKERALQIFTWEKIAKDTLGVYEELFWGAGL